MKESRSRSQSGRAGLIALRAAAVLIVATGLNDMLAGALPRYEPLYLYLAAIALVTLLDGILLGTITAAAAIAFYSLLFLRAAPALLPILGAVATIAVAGLARAAFRRARHEEPPPIEVRQEPPMIEASVIDDHDDVLAAIERLRRDMTADTTAARDRENALRLELRDARNAAAHAQESERAARSAAAAEAERIVAGANRAIEDLALRMAELEQSVRAQSETRVRQERERGDAAMQTLAEVQAALEAAGSEARRAKADREKLVERIAELEESLRDAEVLRTQLDAAARDTDALRREVQSLRTARDHATHEAGELRTRLDTAARDRDALRRELEMARDQATREAAELRVQLDAAARDNDTLRHALKTARDHATREAEALRTQLTTATREAEAARSEAEREAEAIRTEGHALKTARDAATREAEAARSEAERQAQATREAEAAKADALDAVRTDRDRLAGRVAELERAIRAAVAEQKAATTRVGELEQAAATHQKEFDDKLQKIVAHLAEDHENDLGNAMMEKEAARAEARNATMRLAAAQQKLDEEREQATALLAETRAAWQAELDRLHARIAELEHTKQPQTKPRILVAHPDAELREAAKGSLERAGFSVTTAGDGLEGLRVAIASLPDVVIADAVMPKMDGRELCQLLKSQEKTAHIKVVLLTRAGAEVQMGEALAPDDVLKKPVPFDVLRNSLATLLSSSRSA